MLREFLEEMEEVEEISRDLSTELEMTPFICGAEKKRRAVLFTRVKNHPNARVLASLLNSRDVIAKAIGAKNRGEIIRRMTACMDAPKSYRLRGDAPFMENEINNPDIKKYVPLLKFYDKDGSFYTSSTIIVAKDEETGKLNYSFHRMMYLGKNRFVLRVIPGRHLSAILERAKSDDVKVAVFNGVHPAVEVAAATSFVFGFNEMEFANSLLDEKLECVELDDGLHVPAHAEMVMIGRIKKNELADEGPFVDLTGTWDVVRKQPVLEVEKLYFRDDLIYRTILPGGVEHRYLMGIPQEPRIFRIVSNTLPRVKNVVLTEAGGCWLHAVVSITKKVEGEGKNVGMAALAAHPSLKRVVVVDDDIDITDEREVEWAIATRVQPDRDVVVIPDCKGSSLDPSQDSERHVTAKWIIDATAPVDRKDEFRRVS